MSEIDSLALGTSLDLKGLSDGFSSASEMVDGFLSSANTRLQGLTAGAASIDLSSGFGAGGGGGGAADVIGAMLPLANKLQTTLMSAMAPLKTIGATISAQFQQVGATLEATGRRAESHFKFAEAEASLGRVNQIVKAQPAAWQKLLGYVSGYPLELNRAEIAGSKFAHEIYANITPTKAWGRELEGAGGKLGKLKAPRINFDNSTRSVNVFARGVDAASRSVKSIGFEVAAAFGIFGLIYKTASAVSSFFTGGIKGASDLNETVSKTRGVLGSASGEVEKFADSMASRFGLVKGETLDLASGLGGLAKGLGGLKGDKLASFSKQFTSLAADLSSNKNISLKNAGDALRIGLSGEQSDQLKQLGVTFNEDSIKAKAYAAGLAQVGTKLSEQAKFAARALIIQDKLRQLNVAGDLERTAGGTANSYRRLTGTLSNLATSIGGVILPVVDELVGGLNGLASSAGKFFEDNKATLVGWVDATLDGFDVVASVVTNLPSAFEVMRLSVVEKLMQVGDVLATLGPNAIIVATYIADNWSKLLADAFNGTVAGLKNLWTNFQAVGTAIGEWFADPTRGFHVDWTPLLDGFKATADKFPELLSPVFTDMSKRIADAARPIGDDLAARRARRAAAKLKGAGAIPGADADMADAADAGNDAKGKGRKPKPFELKFAGAEELGTKEAYTSIVRSLGGRGRGMEDVARSGRDTAANTRQSARALGNIDRKLGAPQKQLVIP